jgi:hypothetical protein
VIFVTHDNKMKTTLNITRRHSMNKYLIGSAILFTLVAFSGTAFAHSAGQIKPQATGAGNFCQHQLQQPGKGNGRR